MRINKNNFSTLRNKEPQKLWNKNKDKVVILRSEIYSKGDSNSYRRVWENDSLIQKFMKLRPYVLL